MIDNDSLRIAGVAAANVGLYLVFQKARAHLRAQREQQGRTLLERLGYRLGRLWSRTHRAAK